MKNKELIEKLNKKHSLSFEEWEQLLSTYTKEDYLTLFHKIRNRVSNCTISTDIIVGFPGETKEDFEF